MIRAIITRAGAFTKATGVRPNRVKLSREYIYAYHDENNYRSVLEPDQVHGMKIVPTDEKEIIEPYYEEEK